MWQKRKKKKKRIKEIYSQMSKGSARTPLGPINYFIFWSALATTPAQYQRGLKTEQYSSKINLGN
jgi:hypothetical protein